MTAKTIFYLALVVIGATWGLTFPISKIAVSTGYQPYGILVWQQTGTLMLTAAILVPRRKSLRLMWRYAGLYVGVSLLGSVLSGYFSYTAAAQLPAGVMAIVIALVPLFSLPIALAMGFEKFAWIRVLGLGFGALAVVVLVAPSSSLPDPGKAIFVLVAMLATLAYGLEGNFLEWFKLRRAGKLPDPFHILFGASVVGLAVSLPLSLMSGQFIDPLKPWAGPEWAIVGISLLSTLAYGGYIWLIGRTGPVFAAQVSYLVTGFGVVSSILWLGETYSGWIWLALVLIMAGLFMVQPGERAADT